MSESIKLKQSIIIHLNAIAEGNFEEPDIKGLLIDIREYIRGAAILRELADFIAHPKRSKGISHKLLNSRYAKLSLVEDQMKKLKESDGWKDLKTEWDLSAAMLGSISVDRIESKLFRILFVDGIEDVSEIALKKYYKMSRQEILKVLSNSYFESDGFHILKNLRQRAAIDDVLKFIRGAVSGATAFTESAMVKDFENALKTTIQTFELDRNYNTVVKTKIKDVVLCIMCLLHDARLIFFDGHEARIFLGVNHGTLILGTEGTVFQFTLFRSTLLAMDYLTDDEFKILSGRSEEILQINAKRNSFGKLTLQRQ